MASATALPTMGTQHLALNKDHYSTQHDDGSSTEFWTNMIRKNLTSAAACHPEANDDGTVMPVIDEEIMNAPRRKSARDTLAYDVAAQLYPDLAGSVAAIIKYEKDVVMLRHMYVCLLYGLVPSANVAVSGSQRNGRQRSLKPPNATTG
jgi:hypothetical protein